MTTAEARENLHRLIDALSPKLLTIVTEFVEFLMLRRATPDDTPNNLANNRLLPDEERLTRLNQLFGAWADAPELIETFAELDRDRHAYRGRPLETWD